MKLKDCRVVFFGTPEFAAEQLEFLVASGVNLVGVVSKPDQPQGRHRKLQPTPVRLIAEKYRLPLFQPLKASSEGHLEKFASFDADLYVVVAYGEIIKQHLLDLPKLGCINLHASLLPYYRGAAPIQRAIIDGAKSSGISIIHMVKKMDAGDVIIAKELPIGQETTFGQLREEMSQEGRYLLLRSIEEIAEGVAQRTAQDHDLATFAPKVEVEECQIDWNWSCMRLHNLIRGVNPEPGAWCWAQLRGELRRLKIWRSLPLPGHMGRGSLGGWASYDNKGKLAVYCAEGALQLLELQLEGKKKMSAQQLMQGLACDDWVIQ